jgi:hypothetical protein
MQRCRRRVPCDELSGTALERRDQEISVQKNKNSEEAGKFEISSGPCRRSCVWTFQQVFTRVFSTVSETQDLIILEVRKSEKELSVELLCL